MKEIFIIIASAAFVLAVLLLTSWLWIPSQVIMDSRHDRRSNGIWLQHGWLGDDAWFVRHHRQTQLTSFRNPDEVRKLADNVCRKV